MLVLQSISLKRGWTSQNDGLLDDFDGYGFYVYAYAVRGRVRV